MTDDLTATPTGPTRTASPTVGSVAHIEAVVFDYGGVLSVSPFGRMAEWERALDLAPGTIADLMGYGLDVAEPEPGAPYSNKWHLLEIGAIGIDEYADWVFERSAAVFGEPVDLRTVVGGGFSSMGILWPMVHEVQRLHRLGYRLAVCTNNIAAFRDTWQAQLPIRLFDVVVDSSEEGVRKPDPAIYELTAERLGVELAACAFLDDHPANIAAAHALGMHAICVRDDNVLGAIDELRGLLAAAPMLGRAAR